MTITPEQQKQIQTHIRNFAFPQLFNYLGWNNYSQHFSLTVAGRAFTCQGVAEKGNYAVFVCSPHDGGPNPITIPDAAFESLLAFFGRYQWHLDDRPPSAIRMRSTPTSSATSSRSTSTKS